MERVSLIDVPDTSQKQREIRVVPLLPLRRRCRELADGREIDSAAYTAAIRHYLAKFDKTKKVARRTWIRQKRSERSRGAVTCDGTWRTRETKDRRRTGRGGRIFCIRQLRISNAEW